MTETLGPRDLRRMALTVLMPGLPGTKPPSWIERFFDDGLAAVCLYGDNVHTHRGLGRFVEELRKMHPQILVAIDEEGDDVTRIHYHQGSPYPGNGALGRLRDTVHTQNTGAQVGWTLRDLGINFALAPSVDVNSNSDNPVIGTRSFGSDPVSVAAHGAAWIEGLQSQGVAACAKHFPGHGDTATSLSCGLTLCHPWRSVTSHGDRSLRPRALRTQN